MDFRWIGFKLVFVRIGFSGFSLDWVFSVFFGFGSGRFFLDLDLVGFSSDLGLVFSRVWISNGIFKKRLK